MSWVRESSLNWFHRCFLRVLKCGRIPKHVGFIMDGNRRFAKKNNVEKVEGHLKGFDKLSETLQWCLDLGVSEVTVYAFSIENFKRSSDEVSALMNLAREKFKRLLDESEKLKEQGIRIRFLGNISLLPDDIIKLIAEAELVTKSNSKSILNVAFSYTAQEEITNAVNTILSGLGENHLESSDVDVNLVSRCLYTSTSSPPDMIIRTSGESRLSDFMLFQGAVSYIYFTDILWPELSAWDLLWAVFHYQRVAKDLCKVSQAIIPNEGLSNRACSFVDLVNQKRFEYLNNALVS